MVAETSTRVLTRPLHQRYSSDLFSVDENLPIMSENIPINRKSKSQPELGGESELSKATLPGDSTHGGSALLSADGSSSTGANLSSTPPTPRLSRSSSFSDDESSFFPPVDRLTVFDFIENLSLPQRLEKLQSTISAQKEKVRRQQQRIKSSGMNAKDRVVDEWRRRLPPPDEQLDRYRKRMRESVDRLGRRWNDSKAVTWREKLSFIAGVLNIFISGYLVGARPEWFHIWYTVQLLYFMPIRWYTYHKRGYHYFLADLCYFVNFLCVLSIWVFPQSKRLFISTYCLAFGNNAVAIAMWRNSLVFHSMDKVTSLFIHIMPCVTLHCIVHLLDPTAQAVRFPAIYKIRFAAPDSPLRYSLGAMIVWATVPYACWQLSYHFLITVRRREKIAAGRPTSFTWLRKSYAPTWIGKFVLSLPDALQESAFMLIQYTYAVGTMLPCPLWFYNRWASAGFLAAVFVWSVHNGATYYIDVFGTRFQKELEQLKADAAKWQASPDLRTPLSSPSVGTGHNGGSGDGRQLAGGEAEGNGDGNGSGAVVGEDPRKSSIDKIPMLDEKSKEV